MNKKLAAGLAGIAGVAALILASTASDPPGSIIIKNRAGEERVCVPRLYRSALVGDGMTDDTGNRPAIADDLSLNWIQEDKPFQWKWDSVSGQVIVWTEGSEHAALAQKHEFLGTPEAGP